MDPAYLCFLLCGAGQLFPWSSLITAADYWESRYPGKHTDRLLTACYLPANLLAVAGMIALHGRLRPRLRVVGGLLGFTAAMCAVVLMDYAAPTPRSLAVILALVSACGCCDGLVSGALFGEAASLAPRYSQAVMAGCSLSGVAVSLLRIATKATLPDTPQGLRQSASLYFGCAAAVCLTCALVYGCVLPRLALVRQRRVEALEVALAACEDEWESEGSEATSPNPLLPMTTTSGPGFKDGQIQLCSPPPRDSLKAAWQTQRARQAANGGEQFDNEESLAAAKQPLLPSSGRQGLECGNPMVCDSRGLSSKAVLGRIWPLAAANAIIFTVTLSIFPGVLAEDEHSKRLGSWFPILLIATFNCGDWVGKTLPGWATFRIRSQGVILLLATLRAVFVPAFRLAAVHHFRAPAVFGLAAALGLSNGYCLACSMVCGPACVPAHVAPLAGNLLVLFMVLGLCGGAACSFLWLLIPLPDA